MRRLLPFVFAVVLMAGGAFARQYRDFTDTKGRTIRGCVQAFDERSGTVTFERDNHRTSKVPITIFSEADQTYIREWNHAKFFLSAGKFKISVERTATKDKENSYKNESTDKKVEDMGYYIMLENRSQTMLENLEVAYCIYYEQDEVKNKKSCRSEGVYCGDFPAMNISPRAKKKLKSDTVKIYRKELSADWIYTSGTSNMKTGRVRGIWVRVTMKLSSGEKLTRDYCLPDSLENSKVWMTSSVNVGMN